MSRDFFFQRFFWFVGSVLVCVPQCLCLICMPFALLYVMKCLSVVHDLFVCASIEGFGSYCPT